MSQADDHRHAVPVSYPGFNPKGPYFLPKQNGLQISHRSILRDTVKCNITHLPSRSGTRKAMYHFFLMKEMQLFFLDAFWWLFLESFASEDFDEHLARTKRNILVSDKDMATFGSSGPPAAKRPLIRKPQSKVRKSKLPPHVDLSRKTRKIDDVARCGSSCSSTSSLSSAVLSEISDTELTAGSFDLDDNAATSPPASPIRPVDDEDSEGRRRDLSPDPSIVSAASTVHTLDGAMRKTPNQYALSRPQLRNLYARQIDVYKQVIAREQHALFTRMAGNYTRAIQKLSIESHFTVKDIITRILPDVLAQALYISFVQALPFVPFLLDLQFQAEVGRTVSFWTGGVERQMQPRQWAVHDFFSTPYKKNKSSGVGKDAAKEKREKEEKEKKFRERISQSKARTAMETVSAWLRNDGKSTTKETTEEEKKEADHDDVALRQKVKSAGSNTLMTGTVSDDEIIGKRKTDDTKTKKESARARTKARQAEEEKQRDQARNGKAPVLSMKLLSKLKQQHQQGSGVQTPRPTEQKELPPKALPMVPKPPTQGGAPHTAREHNNPNHNGEVNNPRRPGTRETQNTLPSSSGGARLPSLPENDPHRKRLNEVLSRWDKFDEVSIRKRAQVEREVNAMRVEMERTSTTHTFSQAQYLQQTESGNGVGMAGRNANGEGLPTDAPNRVAKAYAVGPQKRTVQVIKEELDAKYRSIPPWYGSPSQRIPIRDQLPVTGTKFALQNWSPLVHRFMLTNGLENRERGDAMHWTM